MIHLVPDATVVIQGVIFLIVLLSLTYFLFKPFIKVINARRVKTDALLSKVRGLEIEIKKLSNEYEYKIAGIRKRGHEEKTKIRKTGIEEETKIKERARADVEKMLKESSLEVDKIKNELTASLKKEIPKFAKEILKNIEQN